MLTPASIALLILGPYPMRSPALEGDAARTAIVEGARRQVTLGAGYSQAYYRMAYPRGDVPPDTGACTDVVVRALRWAGHDLQESIHEDAARADYPRIRGRRDPNIDHRRCPNQVTYFRRHGDELPLDPGAFQPGHFVFWKLDGGMDHVGVVTDRQGRTGRWLVVHNLGGVREEDVLTRWRIVGHFRYPR